MHIYKFYAARGFSYVVSIFNLQIFLELEKVCEGEFMGIRP